MLWRYLIVVFVCVSLTNSQQCIKLVTSLCDDVTSPNLAPEPGNPIRGKAGPKGDRGEKGDRGQKGENSDEKDFIAYVIAKMNATLSQLQGELTDVQTRLADVENRFAITCGPPIAAPENGLVTCSNANMIGSVCTFTCNEGYVLSDINLINTTCVDNDDGDTDGEWSSIFPQCRVSYELRLTSTTETFDEAQEMCVQMGGNLMQKSILTDTPGGNYIEKVNNTFTEEVGWAWVGITDRVVEGTWKYLNGETFNEADAIFSWGSNEPNGGTSENCGHIFPPDFNLNDVDCDRPGGLLGICEIVI